MNDAAIRAALASAINAGVGPAALKSLPPVMYPERQLQISELPNGAFEVHFHYHYKHRRKTPLPDMEEIRLALNAVLPNGLYVLSVKDAESFIIIFLRWYPT